MCEYEVTSLLIRPYIVIGPVFDAQCNVNVKNIHMSKSLSHTT